MVRNRNLKGGMSCATTLKKKSSNARGCNTEHYFPLSTKVIAESVIEIGLASTPRPMKKKYLPYFINNSRGDSFKGSMLIVKLPRASMA
jgi:hypothetical protein